MSSLPAGGSRLALSRALLSGLTTAALLPELVRARGGDARTCLQLGALFAVGTLASELPSALLAQASPEGAPRTWLVRAGLVQAVGLLGMAYAGDLTALGAAIVLVGIGAGMCTGAEARASLAIGGDARSIARLEVLSSLGKAVACLAIALLASVGQLPTRTTILFTVTTTLLGAALSRGLPDVVASAHGDPRATRLTRATRPMDERRRALSLGPIALVVGVAALTLAARGTDPIDAFAIGTSGGLFASAALLTGKGLVARMLAPSLVAPRLRGAAVASVVAALALALVARAPAGIGLPIVALACGVAGGAAAAARGVLFARLGAERVGGVAAIEATVRRVAVASAALLLSPALGAQGWLGPYAVAGAVAIFGAFAVVTPAAARSWAFRRRSSGPVSSAAGARRGRLGDALGAREAGSEL